MRVFLITMLGVGACTASAVSTSIFLGPVVFLALVAARSGSRSAAGVALTASFATPVIRWLAQSTNEIEIVVCGTAAAFVAYQQVTARRAMEASTFMYDGSLLPATRVATISDNGAAMPARIGQYEILGAIKSGAAGLVFKARDPMSLGEVAIKVSRENVDRKWFHREMQLVRRLAHPNIVTAIESGWHHSSPFIAMELLDGPDLDEFVKRRGPLPPQLAIDYVSQAAFGLNHASDRGIVHRDVKPGNLVLHRNVVKVTDFGISSAHATSDKVCDAITLGTLAFMAPEQALRLHDADTRSDIYALGATWFFLLQNESRLPGKSNLELAMSLRRNVTRPLTRDIPDGHRAIIEKMLAYEPVDRFATWGEVIESLRAVEASPANEPSVSVLLVEDNEDDVLLTTRLLQKSNAAVTITHAATVETARGMLSNEHVDLVLLDLDLPDSEGIETLDSIVSASDAPVVVLTGNIDPEMRTQTLSNGARGFLLKADLNVTSLERTIFGLRGHAKAD